MNTQKYQEYMHTQQYLNIHGFVRLYTLYDTTVFLTTIMNQHKLDDIFDPHELAATYIVCFPLSQVASVLQN